MVNWQDYIAAAKELSPSALNLFMYLAKNQDKYEFWFSSKDYCETFSVTDRTFRNARRELLDKGYLKEGKNNHTYFDASGAYKESIESLKNRIVELGTRIQVISEDRALDYKKALSEANIKSIQDEFVLKKQLKELVSFGEDILREITEGDFKNLL